VVWIRPAVDDRRLEQALEVVAHRPRGRQCGEIGRPLGAACALPSENSTEAPSISTNTAPSVTISACPR
jgi:hypothetical protein